MPVVPMEEENCIPHLTIVAQYDRNEAEMVTTKSLIVAYGLALLPVLVSSSPIVPRYFE